mmetsp:Transcript_22634/g.49436  ORF Transcript_22634/g.49436 Transcript_22634/m.49436 type:complete len:473 (-) Transcript_22634:95-1513(-)|eukprot:CAMPEP_0168748786 /NCGR_PEP_ID=MMETSP0724-20121128/16360_1 /TAXON_ID=265536 /ORGANISM="Amphiprora sp., Strain CCMP467" /LENGTH=472 /DNA_ID=CAMNT_0008796635 /DNA_START=26 /DNA_END=1444 /DNA_ORIENTATION=+
MADHETMEQDTPADAFVIDDEDEDDDEEIPERDESEENSSSNRGELEKHSTSDDAVASPKKQQQLSAEIELPVRLQSERTQEHTIRAVALGLIVTSLLGLMLYGVYERETVAPAFSQLFHHNNNNNHEEESGAYQVFDADAPFTKQEIQDLQHRLAPKDFLLSRDGKTLMPRQFLHLHHMKTGGTSMDYLLRCATSRLHQMGYTVPFSTLHECSPSMYKQCLSVNSSSCHKRFSDAAVVSFCAPLRDLPAFSWTPSLQDDSEFDNGDDSHNNVKKVEQAQQPDHPVHAVTVLRHPVERVWSMYRFRTKACYKCKTLKEVYETIDAGQGALEFGEMCVAQLQNHMTRNLIQHKMEGPEDEIVQQAVSDIKSFFTLIGLTEDMNSTRAMVNKVFPWMSDKIEGSSTMCLLVHANKSPTNNRCGPGGTHWDLPPHPSEEDAELIRQHNPLDLQIYDAGERQHRLQKIALGLEDPQ